MGEVKRARGDVTNQQCFKLKRRLAGAAFLFRVKAAQVGVVVNGVRGSKRVVSHTGSTPSRWRPPAIDANHAAIAPSNAAAVVMKATMTLLLRARSMFCFARADTSFTRA